jgi:hypothetical protein
VEQYATLTRLRDTARADKHTLVRLGHLYGHSG